MLLHITPVLQKTIMHIIMNKVGCTDALVALLDDICKYFDKIDSFGAQLVLFVISKAFYLMQHHLFITKLNQLSALKPLTRLISNYLKIR